MLAYLVLGSWQYSRALDTASHWLTQQNIAAERLTVRPTISNLWLWRVLYKDIATQRWQTQALYLPYWSSKAAIKKGGSAAIYSNTTQAGTQTHQDVERFNFFSDGYLSKHYRPDGSFYIGDIRYGLTPESAQPLWGIELTDDTKNHVIRHRSLRGKMNWDRVTGLLKGDGFKPVQ